MSSDYAVRAEGLSKAYLIFDKPSDRLKQMFLRRRKYYTEYWAVQNTDLTIARGETLGIIGRNGSGKSTLLQMIAGTLRPNAGQLDVRGRIAPLLELGAGFNPEFTGRENVKLAATVMGLTGQQLDERAPLIHDFAGIGDFIDQPVKTYSSGMYARLAFAVAAHVDADILIVDEILAVGDAAFTQKCMRFIRDFKKRGTLLFVSHDASAVNALCDRAIWMDKGQIVAEGPAKDVTLAYQAAVNAGETEGGFSISGRRREIRPKARRDLRQEIIAGSDKANIIDVFDFDPDAPSFGASGGRIVGTRFLNDEGDEMPVVEGGEEIVLEIRARADTEIRRPIIGFYVRDRLGQNLFGDNTYLTHRDAPAALQPGSRLTCRFAFQMPYLPDGEYAVCVAFADGTQQEHVQHHWVDEALIIRCEGGHYRMGLIGIPMHAITMDIENE